MADKNLFHVRIGDGIYLISTDLQGKSMLPGPATTNSYLVVGNEKAVLFDLAVDDPALREYAQNLAGKPMMLVLSHGHYDHIYHLEQFSDVWLHEKDASLLQGGGAGLRKVMPCPNLHFLAEGDVIDPGDRKLDVIHIPGHTPGSILLLDRKSRILLSGDTGTRRLLYGITGFVSFEDFCDDLRRLQSFDFDVMYSAHDRCALPKVHIDTMLDVIENQFREKGQQVTLEGVGDFLLYRTGKEEELHYFDICTPM